MNVFLKNKKRRQNKNVKNVKSDRNKNVKTFSASTVLTFLQHSPGMSTAAKLLSPFFIFCCFRCVMRPLDCMMNYVFACLLYSFEQSIK